MVGFLCTTRPVPVRHHYFAHLAHPPFKGHLAKSRSTKRWTTVALCFSLTISIPHVVLYTGVISARLWRTLSWPIKYSRKVKLDFGPTKVSAA